MSNANQDIRKEVDEVVARLEADWKESTIRALEPHDTERCSRDTLLPYLVYHATEQTAPQFPQDYKLVAKVEASSRDGAFTMTQHGAASWTTYRGIAAYDHNPRSSQVGDIILHDEVPMRFDGKGWQTVETTQAHTIAPPKKELLAPSHCPSSEIRPIQRSKPRL